MATRLGLGPVFAFEWLTTSRRWQVYAGRSLFVAALLVGLVVVWFGEVPGRNLSVKAQARVGQLFFYAIAGTQLALVLLAAPAATAGALCVDKARGTLAHVMITDLSDAEIVLGKLAARLIPVAGFLFCTLPVMALTTLMGGIDPWALSGAFAITLAVGILGCALALLLSVWGSKAHEVLMGTYAILGVWLLAGAMWAGVGTLFPSISAPEWLEYTDPFSLAFGPQTKPGIVWLPTQVAFVLALLGISAAMTVLAVFKVRAVAVRQWGQGTRSGRIRRPVAWLRSLFKACGRGLHVRGFRLWPGPSLDGNPVLWREWHRRRPSRWLRYVWGLFIALTSLFSAIAIVANFLKSGGTHEFGALVVAFSVSVGLLLVAVSAPTSLSEERVRGSLDVLMATPLPTHAIVWGKWWGTYRVIPWLTVWPVLITLTFAARSTLAEYGRWLAGPEARLTLAAAVRLGRWAPIPVLMFALILAEGALVTSAGLLLATRISRLGRALATSVAIHVFLCVGWVMMLLALTYANSSMGLTMLSPFWGTGLLTVCVEANGFQAHEFDVIVLSALLWIVFDAVVAAFLLWATFALFDRCLGRVPAEPRAGGPRGRIRAQPAPAVAMD